MPPQSISATRSQLHSSTTRKTSFRWRIAQAILLLLVTLTWQSCQKPEEVVPQTTPTPVPQGNAPQGEVINFLAELTGAPASTIRYNAGKKLFVIDDDMLISQATAEAHYTSERGARTEQRRGQWLLKDEVVKNIKVFIGPNVPGTWKMAIREAIPEWNAVTDTKVYFSEVSSSSQAHIQVNAEFDSIPEPGATGLWAARQYLPDENGNVGGGMTVNSYFSLQTKLSPGRKKFAIAHELGHAIGLSHTDKPATKYVDYRMANTPQMDANSVMNAYVKDWNGFSLFDKLATQMLYPAKSWLQLPGSAKDVGTAGGLTSLHIISNIPASGGYAIRQWNGNGWSSLNGGAVRVAVTTDGIVWVVNNEGKIFRRNGVGSSGTAWIEVPGRATDIAAGGNRVFILGQTKVEGGYNVYVRGTTAWIAQPGGGVRIAVGPDGQPWVVNDAGKIFKSQFNGTSWTHYWKEMPGSARDIAIASDGFVYVIGNTPVSGGYSIHRWNDNRWSQISGGGVAITARPMPYGPIVVNSQGSIYQWE